MRKEKSNLASGKWGFVRMGQWFGERRETGRSYPPVQVIQVSHQPGAGSGLCDVFDWIFVWRRIFIFSVSDLTPPGFARDAFVKELP